MARKTKPEPKPAEHYAHDDKERMNNPPIGLVTPRTDPDMGEKKTYAYDPHLDPQLQWAGKTEHTSFAVPTVSLHVHERIETRTIINAVKKAPDARGQDSLFGDPRPLREALAFYQHQENWSNRLVAGDSLLVMNSLLEKEGMAGKVQMVYFDPPYGIKYGSNFQPFVNRRDVKDGKDEDLSSEPEMIKAFRDTWELGIHSYLTYLRDRLLLVRELLSESGSVFVQISDDNVHHVRELMDEVFGVDCCVVTINLRKKGNQKSNLIDPINDYIVWYSKNPRSSNLVKFRKIFTKKEFSFENLDGYSKAELVSGEILEIKGNTVGDIAYSSLKDFFEANPKARLFKGDNLTSGGIRTNQSLPFEFNGKIYVPKQGNCWKTTVRTENSSTPGMVNLAKNNRILASGTLFYKRYHNDFDYQQVSNWWDDFGGATNPIYVVQTNPKVIQRCILMTTDPSDLVLDITCGSGTTAYVAEQWGRRWITCDTSRVALTLAKQRLLTASFDYYQLAQPSDGVASGFVYKTVSHVTLGSIANNEPPATETLYDQPLKDNNRSRITGPFTFEAVPTAHARSLDDVDNANNGTDNSITRSGETHRQNEWRDELLKTGVRAKGGGILEFSRIETLAGAKYIQAQAETKTEPPKKVLIVFGPEFAPLDVRTVENAWQEARLFKPDILLFCAFQFDEEAAKNIDAIVPAIDNMQLLKAQMNADLLTDDLRKNRSSNESFWLIGQPDVKVHKLDDGMLQIEVLGFDYYNPKTGNIDSGEKNNIAMWLLDTDYDGRSLFPKQVFFPLGGSGDGWDKLAKNLKAEIDAEKIEAFAGTLSLPFVKTPKIAIKIIDDRGIECLRVINL